MPHKKTFRHQHQLIQLKRLDPPAHARAETALNNGFVAIASSIVTTALQAALTRFTHPEDQAWTEIVQLIEAQKLPPVPGTLCPAIAWQGRLISFYRRGTDDRVVLYNKALGSSRPIAFFGRDWDPNHQSSAYAGRWKLTSEARANFEEFIARVPGPSGYTKIDGQWRPKW